MCDFLFGEQYPILHTKYLTSFFPFKHESQLYFIHSCTGHYYWHHHLLQSAGQKKKYDERSLERYRCLSEEKI